MDNKAMKTIDLVSDQGNSPDLADAVRRARIERAEKTGIANDLIAAEHSRLEALENQLKPILQQLPRDADLFNHGLVGGERPRFYVDMISFIEMSRDRRTYRFLMDTPSGRQLLGESDDAAIMVGAVTNYLGKRLVEREVALSNALSFDSIDRKEDQSTLELENSSTVEAIPVIVETSRQGGSKNFLIFVLGLVAGIASFYIGTNWSGQIAPEITRVLSLFGSH
jgi:hypothetical protein